MKKGFTLIEFLAVITILAILSIMVSVNINKVIENKKNDVNIASIKELVNVIKQDKTNNMIFTSINVNIIDGNVSYTYGGIYYEVLFSGKGINDGIINIKDDGSYEIPYLDVSGYCYNKETNQNIKYQKKYNNNCSLLSE